MQPEKEESVKSKILQWCVFLSSVVLIVACASPNTEPTMRPILENPQQTISDTPQNSQPPPPTHTEIPAAKPADHPADVIFYNGVVLTMDEEWSSAQALAINKNEIVSVGGEEEVRALVGSSTRMINLEGRTLMPG